MKDRSKTDETALTKTLQWVVDIDVPAIQASVDALRREMKGASREQLAHKIFSRAQLKAAASGFATGLPSNFWTMVPAAIGDVAITVKLEVIATAKVAVLYDPDFFTDEEATWELLIPVFGINVASQLAQNAAIKAAQGVTREVIKKYLSKETLKQFQKVMLKYFGIKVTQKAVITKTIPVVGGVIGGTWNWFEVKLLRRRAIRYFQGKPM
jgi:hypothetical protein